MILGRGTATTGEALLAEYQQLLTDTEPAKNAEYRRALQRIPLLMCQDLGKSVFEWAEEDILSLYRRSTKTKTVLHNGFMSFLILRGYYHPSVSLLFAMDLRVCNHFRSALDPHRQMLVSAQLEMGYRFSPTREVNRWKSGPELELYIWLLAVSGKTAQEMTRDDFEHFRETYATLYQRESRQNRGHPNAHLYRLERILVHVGIIPERLRGSPSRLYFERLPPSFLREAILEYLDWCKVRSVKRLHNNRIALQYFSEWLSERHADWTRLDQAQRPHALEYAHYLNNLCRENHYSVRYHRQLYHTIFSFFDYAIEHQLETHPTRNPFSMGDVPKAPDMLPRYLPDQELRPILQYCETEASLLERTILVTLLHTGIRASELAALKPSDMVQIAGVWKLHIHEGKGLKDRVIPLTEKCTAVLQEWLKSRQDPCADAFFGYHGRPWVNGHPVQSITRSVAKKLGLGGISPHRFRHTFAVALLNYGVRESALQKLMGHASLDMTLEYARILDETVERSFSEAVERMEEGAISWVPNFFVQEDYTMFAEGDAVSWIRLPLGYCRRNPKLHCESDVKCLLCERFAIGKEDLPRLHQMYERFQKLGLEMKADVVAAHIRQLELPPGDQPAGFIPVTAVSIFAKQKREQPFS